MIEDIFKEEIARLSSDKSLPEKYWIEIETAYSKPSRHYHNLSHLNNLVNELLLLKDEINDWQTVVISVAYHDIVYNTLKQDNEEKSAALARERLSSIDVADWQIEKCQEQIMATKKHLPNKDADTNYFTDADLAKLGASPAAYKTYSKQIRKEYKFYPNIIYNPGRQKVLEHFLEMPSIYKTQYFVQKFEEQARQNINAELEQLTRNA